jgi:hypothetical protein
MRIAFGLMVCDCVTTGRLACSVGCIIVKENRANDIELSVSNVRTSLNLRDPKVVESILNAVHMHGNGLRELTDKNERFRKQWIALEALINIGGKNKNIARRIEDALIRLYECIDSCKRYRMKSGFEIIHIKNDRIDQFHYAKENSDRVVQLERILHDLIRAEVGLCHRGYAKEYLEVVN